MICRPLYLSIGLRYSGAFGSAGFAAFVSVMSVIGVCLGTAALIIVSSVMNGLEDNMKTRTMAVVSHAVVSGPDHAPDHAMLTRDKDLEGKLAAIPGVMNLTPVIETEAIVQSTRHLAAGLVTAVDAAAFPREDLMRRSTSFGGEYDRLPRLAEMNYGVILGYRLAESLDVYPGDQVRIIFPRGVRRTMAGSFPSQRLFTVAAVFRVGTDLDASSMIISLPDAQKIMRTGERFDGYRIWLEDPFRVDAFEAALPQNTTVRDWRDSKGELFRAIGMEKKMMSLMLFLIVFVAAFNILSSLIMMVMGKTGEIAILRTMGMRSADIMRIFVCQGAFCGVLGTALGLILGLAGAAWLNEILGVLGLSGQFLLGAPLPVLIDPLGVALVALCSAGLSVLSTVYPSFKAARILPAEVLRYE